MTQADVGRLRWRCRRGMKELDLMLAGWLEQEYPGASSQQRAAFQDFLELPDPLIAAYLLGRETPEDATVVALVERICASRQTAGT